MRLVNPTPAQCTTAERMLKYANASVADMYIRQRVKSSSPNTIPFRVAKAVSTFLTHNTFNQSILIIYQPPLCDISFYSIEYTSLKFPVILAPAISMGPEILKREPEGDLILS